MAIYRWRRCMAGFPPIPYKADIIADYFSVDSTWNTAKTKNIPSIFNGVETDGVETVTSSGVRDRYVGGFTTANYVTLGAGWNSPAFSSLVMTFNFKASTDAIAIFNDGGTYHLWVYLTNRIEVKGTVNENFDFATNFVNGTQYHIELDHPSAGLARFSRQTIDAVTGALGTKEYTGTASDAGNFYFQKLGAQVNTGTFLIWDVYVKTGSTVLVDMSFNGNILNAGTLAVTETGTVDVTTNTVKESYSDTVNTYALMASRLVAEGDGVLDRLALASGALMNLGTRDYDLTFYASIADITKNGYRCGHGYWGVASRCGVYVGVANDIHAVFQADATEYNINVSCASVGISNDSVHKFRIFADRDDEFHFYIDDVEVGTALDISSKSAIDVTFDNHFYVFSDQTYIRAGKCWDIELKYDDVIVGKWALEGSLYDTSGNGNHLTNSGADLTATHEDMTDGVYSYNLDKGFDLYYDTATGLISLYVPYVDGSPVVTSVASYTLDSEHPALEKGHNMADVAVLYSTGLTGNIMDKDNATVWKTSIKSGIYYESGNTTLWHPEEHSPAYMQTHIQDAYKNVLFMACNPNEYVYLDNDPQWDSANGNMFTFDEDTFSFQAFLMYATAKSEAEVTGKLMKYVKYLTGY